MSDRLLRVPEVARVLEIEGEEVYRLIAAGELQAGKGRDGLVYVAERALQDYQQQRAATSR
jgi:hypothetical protein